jgi:carnitine O-acetyltransferase
MSSLLRLGFRSLGTRAMSSSTLPLVQNVTVPADWKAAAPAAPAGTVTYAEQPALPRLPVPELADTLARLADTLAPLARSRAELAHTEAAIAAFARGPAPALQARLRARAAAQPHWLEEWWDAGAYNGFRESVVVNVSYYYGFARAPPEARALQQSPARLAAGLVRAAMLFRRKLRRGELPPDRLKDGAQCMDTWVIVCIYRILHAYVGQASAGCSTRAACRAPAWTGASPTQSPKTRAMPDTSSSSAAAASGNSTSRRTAVCSAWTTSPSTRAPPPHAASADRSRQLAHVYAHTPDEHPAVGVLGAAPRDAWARDYGALAADAHNARILKDVHAAALVLCLDTETPDGPVALSRALWHGAHARGAPLGLRNRWVDKPVQLVVTGAPVVCFYPGRRLRVRR